MPDDKHDAKNQAQPHTPAQPQAQSQELRLTKQDLAELIASAVAAGKAPNSVEQKKLDREQLQIEEDQRMRESVSASLLQEDKNKKWERLNHSHEHSNGQSRCTFVSDTLGGYIICLECQAKIRPEIAIAQRLDHGAIYDNALYNKLFQKLPSNAAWQ